MEVNENTSAQEIIDGLRQLKAQFEALNELLRKKNEEAVAVASEAQRAYDEYFELYKTLMPDEVPDDLEPTPMHVEVEILTGNE